MEIRMTEKQVFIPENIHKKIKVIAARRGITLKKALDNAIEIYDYLLEENATYVDHILADNPK